MQLRGRGRTLARSHASAPSDGSVLRDILTGVPSQDFINKGVISDAAPACFLAELIEHSRIDSVSEMRGPLDLLAGHAYRCTRSRTPQIRSILVSELCQIPSETPVKHCDLRGYSDAHRCCGKSLMKCEFVRVSVPY